MSDRRRALLLAVRLAWLVSLVVALAVLHLPAPSAMADPADEALVRQAWQAGGDSLSWLARPVPEEAVALGRALIGDKTAHVALFLPLGFFGALARRLRRRSPWVVLGGLGALALASEALQLLEGRRFDVLDIVANLAGVGAGMAMAATLVVMVRRARRCG